MPLVYNVLFKTTVYSGGIPMGSLRVRGNDRANVSAAKTALERLIAMDSRIPSPGGISHPKILDVENGTDQAALQVLERLIFMLAKI